MLRFNAVDFGTAVTIGKIYRAALAVQGVDYAELMWLDIGPGPTVAQDQAMAPITTTADPTPNPTHVKDIHTDPLLIPRIKPPMNIKSATVTNKALTSNVATLSYAANPGFSVGNIIDVSGVDAVFNGRFTVTVVTPTSLSYAKTNANVASIVSGGTVTQVDQHAPELETDFPGLDEVERTHDGLWVWADGGVPGT
jgi:hypothetical protein